MAERANTLTRKPVQDTVVLENIAPLEVDDLSKDPVPVEEFAKYVQTMHKNNGYLLSEEYAVSGERACVCVCVSVCMSLIVCHLYLL